MFQKLLFVIFCSVITTISVAAYGLMEPNVIGYFFCLVFFVCIFLPTRHSSLACGVFTFATIIVWGVISLSGLYEKITTFPEQRLLTYNAHLGMSVFAEDASLVMIQTGNLVPLTTSSIPEEQREVAFLTDNEGFRGNTVSQAAQTIFAGGGFVYGSGNSQADTLAGAWAREYNKEARLLSAPGDLLDYAKLIRTYANYPDKNVILFLSEDSDFTPLESRYISPMLTMANVIKSTNMARFFQLQLTGTARSDKAVRVFPIENKAIAFSQTSIDRTTSSSVNTGPLFAEVLTSLNDVVDHIVFIPSKYRIYNDLIDKGNSSNLPSAAWNHLQKASKVAGIPCTDLTPVLKKAAASLWKDRNELIYWADDSHWNRAGIQAATETIHSLLQ